MITKKTTYEEVRKIDPNKFIDLESTMRMLYDHGNMTFEHSVIPELDSIPPTNASMREPKRALVAGRGSRAAPAKPTTLKRKTRPDQAALKPPQPEK